MDGSNIPSGSSGSSTPNEGNRQSSLLMNVGGGNGSGNGVASSSRVRLVTEMNPNPQQQQQQQRGSLSLAALRRSSPHHTPTRTLQLSEQEIQQSTANKNLQSSYYRVTIENLRQRPRSNQRNRTPRRGESPLDPDEFRTLPSSSSTPLNERVTTTTTTATTRQVEEQGRRITIRPGGAIGTIQTTRIREESPQRSAKQGPSHRKIRRWNNDKFETLAAEIAPTSQIVADVLRKGKEDAHLYKDIYDPMENKSRSINRFMENNKWNGVRDRFFEGELPDVALTDRTVRQQQQPKEPTSGEEMMFRMNSRLRRVVTKACQNSYPAARVVKTFETFLLNSFRPTNKSNKKSQPTDTALDDNWWEDILLEQPTITKRRDGKLMTAQFYFDPVNATGGFHRLLLHALSQFHGLTVVSRMAQISIGEHCKSRTLTVTGAPIKAKFRLMEILDRNSGDGCGDVESLGRKLEDSWTMV